MVRKLSQGLTAETRSARRKRQDPRCDVLLAHRGDKAWQGSIGDLWRLFRDHRERGEQAIPLQKGYGDNLACSLGSQDHGPSKLSQGGEKLVHEFCQLPSRSQRSEEHTSELQSPFLISYAVFCLK